MGNPEGQLNEIRLFIQEIRREIDVEHFELGDDPRPLNRIEDKLSKISELFHGYSNIYDPKSMKAINLQSNARLSIDKIQEFLRNVHIKGEGSIESTRDFRTKIEELDRSVTNLSQQDTPDVPMMTDDLDNEKTETKLTLSIDLKSKTLEKTHPVIYSQSVFISYAWGGESEEIAIQIDNALQTRGLAIIRDKRDLRYKGSIKEFMERIGQGDCIIVVVSDKYLKSPNCMFELVEISDNKQFHDRVFPVVLSDADIYDPIKQLDYVQYWRDKKAELNRKMKKMDQEHLDGVRDDINLYARIGANISKLADIFGDMNTLTPEMHQNSDFEDLYNALEDRINKGG